MVVLLTVVILTTIILTVFHHYNEDPPCRHPEVLTMQVIEEAREMAVKEHCVEFGTNLWVAESFATKVMIARLRSPLSCCTLLEY